MHLASLWRRFFAYLLDGWVLFILTLGVGWFIWFFFTAPQGQTPGKRLLGIRVLNTQGTRVTARRMWAREVLIKIVFYGIALGLGAAIIIGVLLWYYYLRAFWDKDKQTQHDKWLNTFVVDVPKPAPHVAPPESTAVPTTSSSIDRDTRPGSDKIEEQLRRLAKLRDDDLITPEEFEEKRRQLVQSL